MFGPLGVSEMIFILALALLVFGPRRLPELGRTIGRAMGEFRRASTELRRTLNNELALEDEVPRRPAPAPPNRPRPRAVADGSAIVPAIATGTAPRSERGSGDAGQAAREATAPPEPARVEPSMPEPPPEPIEPR